MSKQKIVYVVVGLGIIFLAWYALSGYFTKDFSAMDLTPPSSELKKGYRLVKSPQFSYNSINIAVVKLS